MADYNATQYDSCYLSAQQRAVSTAFTAVISSIFLPLVYGPAIAFFVGWNCYFGVVRICITSAAGLLATLFGPRYGFYQPFLAVVGAPPHRQSGRKHTRRDGHKVTALPLTSMDDHGHESHDHDVGDDDDNDGIEAGLQVDNDQGSSWRGGLRVFSHITKRNKKVGILGALTVVFALVYTPVIQVLWIKANWSLATPALFYARALSVTIIALPFTIDTQARYGLILGKMLFSKKLVPRLVNVYMALANAVLSIIVVTLYVRAVQVSKLSRSSVVLTLPYFTVILFTLVSPIKSLIKHWPRDQGYWCLSMKAFWTCGCCNVSTFLYVLILLSSMVFTGVVAAGPSISIFGSSRVAGWLQEDTRTSNVVRPSDTNLKDLGSWFHCSSISWWEKAVQILP